MVMGGKVWSSLELEIMTKCYLDTHKQELLRILNGRTWHQTYDGRIKAFRLCGYDWLIFWDNELENESMVAEKIQHFLVGK